ncbi:hypothetical protein AYO43_09495 [Nitrospira sp. SCGC AG-212-E16]|nr:hypothetical protein AYO43_09495 [Nitrospira sp. SCGC AG-212-E16]
MPQIKMTNYCMFAPRLCFLFARRAIFIRGEESGSITSVPVGNYRLRFPLGSDWLSEWRFCQFMGTSEFDEAFDFHEIKSERRTITATTR